MRYMRVGDLRQLSTGMKAVFKPSAERDAIASGVVYIKQATGSVFLLQNELSGDTEAIPAAERQGFTNAFLLGRFSNGTNFGSALGLSLLRGFRILVPNNYPHPELPMTTWTAPAAAPVPESPIVGAPPFFTIGSSQSFRTPRRTRGTSIDTL